MSATWNNGGGGDWDTGADWTGGSVPGYQSVVIGDGATVTFASTDSQISFQGLTVSGGSTFNISGDISYTTGLTMSGASFLNVETGGNYTIGGASTISGSSFNVYGTASTDALALSGGSSLNVAASGNLSVASPGVTVGTGTDSSRFEVQGTASVTLVTVASGSSFDIGSTGNYTGTGGGVTVNSGGSFTVEGTGTVAGLITITGSMVIAAGGSLTGSNGLDVVGNATIYGHYYAGNGAISGTGTVTVNGGTIGTSAASPSVTGTPTILLENGATVYLNSSNPPGTISFGGNNTGTPNTLVMSNYIGGPITTAITGFGPGDVIQFTGNSNTFTGVTVAAGTVGGTYKVTLNAATGSIVMSDVTFASGVTVTSNGNGTYTVPGITDGQIGSSGTYELNACFLEGTAIATPAGEVAVESLKPGDLVTTMEAGGKLAKPVTWLGYRTIKTGDMTGDDAHPVRIKASAFAEGVPGRDLLVTAEHCIYVNGGLIPARLLVNGRSILVDRSISSFTYYHVELAAHGILLAEGLEVESYLDTGNRGNFANAPVPSLRPQFSGVRLAMGGQPVAPLLVEPGLVEPIWQGLNARAQQLGLLKAAAPAFSDDAGLHLVTASGAVLRPLRSAGDKVLFLLPPGAGELSLASRTARPSDKLAYVDDRRELGVLVGEINLHIGRVKHSVTAHLAAGQLSGWFAREAEDRRWTSGLAKLPDGIAAPRSCSAILEIQILQAGPYPIIDEAQAAA